MKDKDAPREICSFFEKKLSLFRRYLLISKRLQQALRNKEKGDFGIFLSRRQECINKIERIDVSIEGLLQGSYDSLSHIPERLKGLIEGYLKGIKSAIETVDLIDRELLVMVREEGESVKRELLQIHNVRQAAQGYKRGKRASPRFLDAIR